MSRVELVEATSDDLERIAEWLAPWETRRWLTGPLRAAEPTATTLAIMVRRAATRLFLFLEESTPVGVVGFSDLDPVDHVGMIWYALGEPSRAGRGLTTAAVGSALERAFGELGLRTVYAWTVEDNVGSRRVLARNGFREIGRMRAAVDVEGRVLDRVYFDRTRADT